MLGHCNKTWGKTSHVHRRETSHHVLIKELMNELSNVDTIRIYICHGLVFGVHVSTSRASLWVNSAA